MFESAGTIQLSNVNGARVRGFQLFVGGSFRTPGDYLNKANGMGDLEVMTEAAPVELGNVVWRDANSNGLQDPGEPGIAGVTVSLFRPGVGADCVAGNADDAQARCQSGDGCEGRVLLPHRCWGRWVADRFGGLAKRCGVRHDPVRHIHPQARQCARLYGGPAIGWAAANRGR